MIYRELLERYYDIHLYQGQYFLIEKGRLAINHPADFELFPAVELYIEVHEETGLIQNSKIKPFSYYVIENIKKEIL